MAPSGFLHRIKTATIDSYRLLKPAVATNIPFDPRSMRIQPPNDATVPVGTAVLMRGT